MKEETVIEPNGTASYSVPDIVIRGISEFFKSTDANGDRALSFTEFRELLKLFYSEGDDDVREALEEPRAAQLLYFSVDTNEDQKLTYEEVEAALIKWVNDEDEGESGQGHNDGEL